MDSDRGNLHLLTCVDEVLEQCEVRRAFGKAPRAPFAGAATVAMFNENLHVDLLSSDDIVAMQAMDVFSKNSPLIPVGTKNPQEGGAPLAIRGLGFSAHRSASRWMKVGHGGTKCGRTCGRGNELNYFCKGSVRAPGLR